MNKYPDDNPKTAIGAKKVPLHLVPPAAIHYTALAMADGAKKYGPYNWRDKAVSVSTYIAAAKRHMDAYWDGEDESQDAGVHHLAHAMACFGIVLDAMSVGMLVDDRPLKGAAAKLQADYVNKEDVKNDQPAAKPDPRLKWTAEHQARFDAVNDRDEATLLPCAYTVVNGRVFNL